MGGLQPGAFPEIDQQVSTALSHWGPDSAVGVFDPDTWGDSPVAIEADDWEALSALVHASATGPNDRRRHLLHRILYLVATADEELDKAGRLRFEACRCVAESAKSLPYEMLLEIMELILNYIPAINGPHGRKGWESLAPILETYVSMPDLHYRDTLGSTLTVAALMEECGDAWRESRSGLLCRLMDLLRAALRRDGVPGMALRDGGVLYHAHAFRDCAGDEVGAYRDLGWYRELDCSYSEGYRRVCPHAFNRFEIELTSPLDPASLFAIFGYDDLLYHYLRDAVFCARTLDWYRKLPASLNAPNFGRPPLHWAARQGAYRCCKLLIDAGANPDAVAWDDITPLRLARSLGHDATARLPGPAQPGQTTRRDRNDNAPVRIPRGRSPAPHRHTRRPRALERSIDRRGRLVPTQRPDWRLEGATGRSAEPSA